MKIYKEDKLGTDLWNYHPTNYHRHIWLGQELAQNLNERICQKFHGLVASLSYFQNRLTRKGGKKTATMINNEYR